MLLRISHALLKSPLVARRFPPPFLSGATHMSKRQQKTTQPLAQQDANSPVPAPDADTPKRRARRKDPNAVSAVQATSTPEGQVTSNTPASTTRRRSRSVAAADAATDDAATAAPAGEGDAAAAPASDGVLEAAEKPAAKRSRKTKPKPEPLPVYTPEMRPPIWQGEAFRILSWNVAGLRALMKKDGGVLARLAEQEQADVICLQEHKLQNSHVDAMREAMQLPGWNMYWSCSTAKAGYSGVAVLSKSEPLGVQYGLGQPQHDDEGRVITAEYPGLYLVSVYTPNSSEGLKRLDYRVKEWDLAFRDHVKALEAKGKPVVITGDLNCAHQEIDIHNPKGNERSAGFTIEERESFAQCYTDNGLVDTFRQQHPGVAAYSYWTYKFNCRAKNKGWRLDYFLVSEGLHPRVHDSYMLQDVMGSDHCPLGLVIKPASS